MKCPHEKRHRDGTLHCHAKAGQCPEGAAIGSTYASCEVPPFPKSVAVPERALYLACRRIVRLCPHDCPAKVRRCISRDSLPTTKECAERLAAYYLRDAAIRPRKQGQHIMDRMRRTL